MKPFHAILSVALLMVGCDQRGTSPNTDPGDGSKNPGTGPVATDSTPTDTVVPGVKLLRGPDLAGPVTASTPGTERRADFYLATDRSLRVRGSSDGAPVGGTGPSFGRQTTWEIRFSSQDSIRGNLVGNTTEVGMRDSLWNFVDSSDGTFPHVVRVRLHNLSGATEARIVADSNALISVKVQAWSGIDSRLQGWTPPLLPGDTVAQLLWAGNPAKKIGVATFDIRIPSSSRY